MTDTHDDTIDPSLEGRLRAALAAAAPTDTRVEPGLEDLRARLDGTTVIPLEREVAPRRPRRPRRQRLLAAAAVLVAAGLTWSVVATTVDDGAGDPVRSGSGTGDETNGAAEATGWYVPEGLPEGWSLQTIATDFQDVEGLRGTCPCATTTWVAPDGREAVVVGSALAGPDPSGVLEASFGGPSEPVVLPDGTEGRVGAEGPITQVVRWLRDGRLWEVSVTSGVAGGSTEDSALAAAAQVLATPDGPPLDGFERYGTNENPGGLRSYLAVTVVLRTPNGRDLAYTLYPSGSAEELSRYVVPQRQDTETQVGPVRRYDWPGSGSGDGGTQLFGRWPGSDVVVNDDPTGPISTDVALAELTTVIEHLKPASRTEWEAFAATATGSVDGATVDPAVLGVERLADLAEPGDPQGG